MAEIDQEGGEGKLSLKKIIIIIVAALVLLVAGGAGTYFLLKGDSSKEGENGHEQESQEEEASVADKQYFDMSKPIVVDFPKGSAVKHGRITISMLADGFETVSVLRKNEPMIRNNLLMLISAQDTAVLNTQEGKENLRKAILDDVNAVVTKMADKRYVKVDEIFFTSFVMQ